VKVTPRDGLVPVAWPALLALGAVVVLAASLMVYDMSKDIQVEDRTNELVGKALRSITLADTLRSDVYSLAVGSLQREELARALARIERDMATYDPLATYAGERDEWTHLQSLVVRLGELEETNEPAAQKLLRTIEASLDHIVQINQVEAAKNVTAILASFHEDFMVDAAGGTIGLVLALFVGAVLLRSTRRQRVLLAAQLALKDERESELEAFAGRVAHDLRGPLGPLRGYAELLRLGAGPPPAELGQRIASATDRMTAIIDDLLTLSISGQPGFGESDVAPVIAQVLEDAAPLLADAKVGLSIADAKVRAPPGALGRIVQNLISNAVKYRAPDRPLELDITVTRRDAEVELVVSDNGIGMDESTAAHAFDPLFRGDTTRKIPGHGLGLAIVKRTVDALGGVCSIVSKLGEGTRVVVRLRI
jgi:signal transduction histidine kinase